MNAFTPIVNDREKLRRFSPWTRVVEIRACSLSGCVASISTTDMGTVEPKLTRWSATRSSVK